MKKGERPAADDMRPNYTRADFGGTLVRGKYAQRLRDSSNVVVIEPELAKAFPKARAVNAALRRLLRKGESASGVKDTKRSGHDTSWEGRRKYAARHRERMSIVLLDADVSAAFPNEDAVNTALRAILDAMPARRPKDRRS